MYPVAVVGDVQKAFHQIEVAEGDRDSLRFLWVKDISYQSSEVTELRFTRVIFGAGPSPFLLNATLQKHVSSYENEDPEFVRNVIRSLFVDDYVGGAGTSEEAVVLKRKLTDIMKQGGFTMHKWKSNSPDLKEVVKDEGVTVESFAKQSLNQKESQSKVLGIKWDTGDDVMTIELSQIAEEKDTGHTLTNREILSLLSKIYDPLGAAGPVTIVARKIFQDICKDGTNWDSAISESEQKKWEKFVSNVLKNPEIMFPRCIV